MRFIKAIWLSIVMAHLLPALGAVGNARAMSVEPLVLDMSSMGKTSRDSFKVVNNASKPLPVEIGISRLELGLNGEQKKQPADDEFIIYPAQAMIPPGGSQVFRVQ